MSMCIACTNLPQHIMGAGCIVPSVNDERVVTRLSICTFPLYMNCVVQSGRQGGGKKVTVDMFCRDLTAAAAAGSIDPVRLPQPAEAMLRMSK